MVICYHHNLIPHKFIDMAGLATELDDETTRKRRYAFQLLIDPVNMFTAGLKAYPEQTEYHNAMAFKISTEWANDEEVIKLKRELVEEHGEAFFLPTKGDVAREIYITAKTAKTAADKLKGFELYANLMSFIEKPAQAVINNTNTQTTNKVMIVPTSGTADDWEQKLIKQQQDLIEHAG